MKRTARTRGNMFVWLLALIVVTVSASVFLVGAVSYGISARSLREQTCEATLLREAQILSRMDIEILGFWSIAQGLSGNRSILDQLTQSTHSGVQDILRFREIMQAVSSLKMANPSVSLIGVYFQRSDIVLTDSAKYAGAEYFQRFSEQDRDAILRGIAGARPFTRKVRVRADTYAREPERDALLMVKSLPYYSQYPFGAVLTEVPLAHLNRMLVPEAGGAQLVFNERDELVLSAPDDLGEEMADGALSLIKSRNQKAGDSFWQDAEVLGSPCFAAVSVSAADNWKIVTLIPAESVYAGIADIRMVTLVAGLVTALVAILISALLLNRLYTPVRGLLNVLVARGMPYAPRRGGGNELEHIGRAIDIAWSENQRMQNLVSGMEGILRQDLLSRLMDDIQVDGALLDEAGLGGMEGYFRVILPEIARAEPSGSDYAACLNALEHISADHPEASEMLLLAREHNRAALLRYTAEAEPAEAIMPMLGALSDALVGAALGVSRALPGIHALKEAKDQAQRALYRAGMAEGGGIALYSGDEGTDRELLLSAIGAAARKGPGALRDLFARAMAGADYQAAYLIDALERQKGDPEAVERTLRSLQGDPSPDEVLRALLAVSGANPPAPRKLSVERLMAYIDAHYSDPNMSLTLLADTFGYSANYIGAAIRERTGAGFLDYLAKLRLSRACELLSGSDMLISSIAQETGFGHVNTFIRTFRKHYQMTPAQYRSRHRGVDA